MNPKTPYPAPKLRDYLTPDDRRMLWEIENRLDALIHKHKAEGAVPLDAVKYIRVMVHDLATDALILPLGWETVPVTQPQEVG